MVVRAADRGRDIQEELNFTIMTDELMIKLLERNHDDLKEVFTAGLHGLQKTVGANAEVAAIEARAARDDIAGIVQRLDKMNGSVAKLQEESNKRQKAVDDFRVLEVSCRARREWPRKNWAYILVGAVVLVLVVVVAYDVLGLRGIVELAKGIR